MTGTTALFEPQPSLEDSARLVLDKTIRFAIFLDFATTFIFYRAKSSALLPTPNLEDQTDPCIYVSQWQGTPVIPLTTTLPLLPFSSPSTIFIAAVEVL
jgi:hypothetical protein